MKMMPGLALGHRGQGMKLQEALRKVIRLFGIGFLQDKRLMSFLSDYKAFDDYPAAADVIKAITTGKFVKELCRKATEEGDDEYLKFADSLKESLVNHSSFKKELADYAVDSVSFALGIFSSIPEPSDHGLQATRNSKAGGRGGAQGYPDSIWGYAPDGADVHRRFFRGKDLTSAFNDGTFSANVADGSFRDIFPGDYITKEVTVPGVSGTGNSVKFIIADLDTALDLSSLGVTAHHAVIVPETPVFQAYMNPTDTTKGGYAASYMQWTYMPAFAWGLAEAFGQQHLLSFTADGKLCFCRLMTLSMVFGKTLPSNGKSYSHYQGIDKSMGEEQLAAFILSPNLRGKNGSYYWLSDVSSSSCFADVGTYNNDVGAGESNATRPQSEVRPFALLA